MKNAFKEEKQMSTYSVILLLANESNVQPIESFPMIEKTVEKV